MQIYSKCSCMNVCINKPHHLRAWERVWEVERRKLSFTAFYHVSGSVPGTYINIFSYPFIKTFRSNLSCISVPGVDGLLLSTCPIYFVGTLNFINDCVSLVIILAFSEPLLCFRHCAYYLYAYLCESSLEPFCSRYYCMFSMRTLKLREVKWLTFLKSHIW